MPSHFEIQIVPLGTPAIRLGLAVFVLAVEKVYFAFPHCSKRVGKYLVAEGVF
ncbi:hypothetical protein TAF16_2857 [Anoxybacillus flavithermus]|uniref:Uncharacterized protein n=1 Tax=Anoxybacillus flavithermus TaxID=33934 RepID=A0A178T4J7_9BACL|nr:hypothetical protein TAF16_2857 [Anoxybacillus flavithermus]